MKQHHYVKDLCLVLCDTYVLYLKSQNYHWHIKCPHFFSYHKFLEEVYKDLADAIDEIAERIRALDAIAPATMSEFIKFSSIKEGNHSLSSSMMLEDLLKDQGLILKTLKNALKSAKDSDDDTTAELLSGRINIHEKYQWMLRSL